jgi:4'-phosphopantetheinyl transferase
VIPVRWLLATAGEEPADDAWLTPTEREALEGLRIPYRRADWRLGRWVAKQAVAAWLGIEPHRIEIRPAPDGAPEAFLDGAPAPVALSISHRAGRAACAVAPAGTALGVDLELIEPRSDEFVQDYFTPAEQELIAKDRLLHATLLWSAKESALKALREGLRMDTREVEVSLPEGEGSNGWSPLTVRRLATGEVFEGWWRREGELVMTVAAAPASRKEP